jgi:arsenate reductase
LIRKTGLRPFDVIRKGEAAVKELGITTDTADDVVIAAMVENPGMIQRPIVEVGNKAVLARPIEKALPLLTEKF